MEVESGEGWSGAGDSHPEEGLRERKKSLMRQLISNTATLMFLEHGFDEVRVSEIAAACDVSEKTIYNYFPTKESLLLDREEDIAFEIRRALGPGTKLASPVEAVIQIMADELDELVAHLNETTHKTLEQISKFNDLIESTPALRAARAEMTDRLAQVAAESLAARAAVDPSDPEPQIAAYALVGLWQIYYRALVKYASSAPSPAEVRDAVFAEVRRAARLIDTGLWSFATVVQGAKSRQQLKYAAEASNEAAKQVLLAIKQAKDAWRQIVAETRARDEKQLRGRGRAGAGPSRAHEAHREAREVRRQAQAQRDATRAARRARPYGRGE